MPEPFGEVDRISVPSTFPLLVQHTVIRQLGQDSLNGPLGNTDPLSNVSRPYGGVPLQADEYVRMIREKRPLWRAVVKCRHFLVCPIADILFVHCMS